MGEEKKVEPQQRGEAASGVAGASANSLDSAASSAERLAGASASRRRKGDPLGRALRVAYDDVMREDVPKDFLDLLGKLD